MSHGSYCPFCKFYHEVHSKDCPYGAALRRIAELERQIERMRPVVDICEELDDFLPPTVLRVLREYQKEE